MKKENSVPNFVENEKKIYDFWKQNNIEKKYLNKNNASEKYYAFLDGPITANNIPGIHHGWNRGLKDMFLKYKTMNGYSAHYQNGFDAQGLWVEVETEKELGLKDKKDIENLGLDKFTEACISRVNRFSKKIAEGSQRYGQFMDWDDSYFTNSDRNITSIWHFLKTCYERGWLVQKYRPMPWCSHCGTSLSEHELADSYKDMTHKAVFFAMPIKDTNDSILVWTTTPWTLAANVAVAVNPELEYSVCKVKSMDRNLIVCSSAIKVLKGDIVEVVKTLKGSELVGLEYTTCFPELEAQNFAHKIVAWDMVDSTEGSGAVHIAPGCGAEDFELGQTLDLPNVIPVDEYGNYYESFGIFAGKPCEDVADFVFEELQKRGNLYYTHDHSHRYPVCWRCKKPLIFRLTKEWYIKADEVRPLLIKSLDDVEWQPEFLKKRMLDWLTNLGDWCISRKRFYGLPLPFYICEKCGKLHVIGSLEELKEKSDAKAVESLPHLHRPYIDEIEITCDCGAKAKRVPDVGDCWLDAGITPFSTKKYFTDKEFFNKNFPAECVIEMREQIRLWFYSLLFMSVTLTGKAPYKKVIGFGMLTAEDGSRFSKTGSNNIQLESACDTFTADAIRYMFASNNLLQDTRFGEGVIEEIRRKFLSLWNSYVFFNTYAILDNPQLAGFKPELKDLDITDKWLLQLTNELIEKAHIAYKTNTLFNLTRDTEKYLDDLSNWYIRTIRKRFWKSEDALDKKVAYYVLYTALKAVAQIMAPITPFMSEYLWQHLVREIEKDEEESVLLSTFPTKVFDINEANLSRQTEDVREILTLAQRLRNENNLKVKQPLQKMFICANDDVKEAVNLYESIVKEELNIKEIIFENDVNVFNDNYLIVNFKTAGAVLKGDVQNLKATLESLTEEEMQTAVDGFNRGSVNVKTFENLSPTLFLLQNKAKPEFVIMTENNKTVVLDINLTEELILEGMFRELTREIQVLRKEANYNVEDRVVLNIQTDGESLSKVLASFGEKIKKEALVTEIKPLDSFDMEKEVEVNGETAKITIKRA
ncbi:MAG: isoleucine--tRNA ligase [Clostridia bacterium]|nr:isoleucine--tRNA ligase [Clostridia bacterium]